MGSNQTWISEVILLGFQVDPELEVFLFGFFLLFLQPHADGERAHPGAHLTGLQTAHPHALLPLTPGHR